MALNKTSISMALTISILLSGPSLAQEEINQEYLNIRGNISVLHDIYHSHWAYNAVKYLVEDLEIMPPRTPDQFRGDDQLTRYEIAEIFYRAIKKIEASGRKDLKQLKRKKPMPLTDVSPKYRQAVNSIVNDYGIMQTVDSNFFKGQYVNEHGTLNPQDGMFFGEAPVNRYEIAYELNRYFSLIEKRHGNQCKIYERQRTYQLRDLDSRHWSYHSVKNIVDRYQIMDGDTNYEFRGGDKLTRYEAAAVMTNFIHYVDECLVPIKKEIVKKVVVKKAKQPLSLKDLRLGASLRMSNSTKQSGQSGMIYGPEVDARFWFPKMGWSRLGLGIDGSWLFYDQSHFSTNNRIKAGANLNWRLLGNDSDEDLSLYLGAGYEYFRVGNLNAHGPRGTLGLELPVMSWFSLFAEDTFSYYLFSDTNGMQWKNELFTGITIPAYTDLSVQLGFADTRYTSTSGTSFGDSGGKLNLRFRW